MGNEKTNMDIVRWLAIIVIGIVFVIIFYYFAIPPILNLISNITHFITSTEFLVGVIVGALTVILLFFLSKK